MNKHIENRSVTKKEIAFNKAIKHIVDFYGEEAIKQIIMADENSIISFCNILGKSLTITKEEAKAYLLKQYILSPNNTQSHFDEFILAAFNDKNIMLLDEGIESNPLLAEYLINFVIDTSHIDIKKSSMTIASSEILAPIAQEMLHDIDSFYLKQEQEKKLA